MKFFKFFPSLALMFLLTPGIVGAAISFVGSAESSSAPNTDTTVDISGLGLLEGDLVIVAGAIGDDDSIDHDVTINTADYTEVADLFANDTDDTNLAVWWKIMGPTPDASVVVEGSTGGTDSSLAVVVMAFRGVDNTTPMDVTPTTLTGLNTMHPNPPSIDHNNPSGVWTVIAGASGHVLAGSGTYTFPTGYTTDAVDRGQDDTNDVTVGMGYRSSGISDPEDPGVMTHSGALTTSNSWAASTIALRPAVVVTTSPSVTNSIGESSVGNTSATLNGSITDDGGESSTERGFAWGTASTLSGGDTSTTTESGSFGTGTFNQSLSNLLSGVTYYYRAYATNSSGIGYASSIETFVTNIDNTPARKIRLFQDYRFKIFNGRIKVNQQ